MEEFTKIDEGTLAGLVKVPGEWKRRRERQAGEGIGRVSLG